MARGETECRLGKTNARAMMRSAGLHGAKSGTVRIANTLLAAFMLACSCGHAACATSDSTAFVRVGRLHGGLSPKSIAWNGHGLFFAQNMMYRHTVAVFNDEMQRCGTISDRVELADLGHCERQGVYKGAPVECVFTADGCHAFVSNYAMEGDGFTHPGCDACHGSEWDGSYVYRINTATLRVDAAYPTGSVPKFMALTPDEHMLLVSNWSSGDVSLIDLQDPGCSERLPVGRYPRGIAIDPSGEHAYVALMGSSAIMRIQLRTREVERFATVGRGPRHLCLDSSGTMLYASLNHEGAIARVDIRTREVTRLSVGGSPRSMVFGSEERCLYVVNYGSARMSKIDLERFALVDEAATDARPIGIAYDARNNRIWVACYSGSIVVFEDHAEAPGALAAVVGKDSCETPSAMAVSRIPALAVADMPSAETGSGAYRVITGAFRDRANAERQSERLRELGYAASILASASGHGLHQVSAGAFDTEAEAKGCLRRLAEHSLQGWVKKP